MNNITFEEMKDEQLNEVLEIYNYYVLHSNATFQIKPLSAQEMKAQVFSENIKFKSYVIFSDKTLCGYVSLSQFKKREAYDATAEIAIYLRNDFTCKGIGGLAIGFIEKVAKMNDFHALLAVITGSNTGSIHLFSKNGYEKCAHYKEVGKKFGELLDVVSYQKILK